MTIIRGESWDEQLRFTASKACEKLVNGEPDWEFVQRAVAASEPPRIIDIPEHIKFLQKWGGGKSQQFVFKTMEYLEIKMPSGRIVGGPFIERLADLKLAPSKLMPKTIHACLMAQAVGEKDRDGVACNVTEAHVKSLATSNLEKGMEVNKMLVNAEKLFGETHPIALGDMAVEFVNFMFDINSSYESLEEISAHFINQVTGAAPVKATISHAESDAKTVVEFTADGENDAGKLSIRNAGFKVGACVDLKKLDTDEKQFQIAFINDDGSVGLHTITGDGAVKKDEVFVVDVKEFSDYRLCRSRRELLEGYPDNGVSFDNREVSDFTNKNVIGVALSSLLETNTTAVALRVQSKPSQRVFTLDEAAPGEICLAPMTHKIDKLAAGATVPENCSTVVIDKTTYILKKCIEKKWVAEYWALRPVSEENQSNMKLRDFVVQVPIGKNVNHKVVIKCAVNRKKLGSGDELLLYKPPSKEAAAKAKAASSDAKAKAASSEPSAKRQKH